MPVKFLTKPPAIFLAISLALALLLPLPFAIIQPGPVSDLLGSNIQVANGSDVVLKPTNGKLYSLSVFVNSPSSKPRGIQVLTSWILGSQAVVPFSSVYETGASNETEAALGARQMSSSQQAATIAAANLIKSLNPEQPLSWKPDDIAFKLKYIGGPSAGLAFGVALVSRLQDPALIAGRVIAATGTITEKGAVGPIGGINQKYISAKQAKATIFLMPKENCQDLADLKRKLPGPGNPAPLPKIIAVKSLLEAVHALADTSGDLNIAGAYHC
jgi:PDZ domain-containing protein